MAISTVRKGRDEARAAARPDDVVKVRRSSGKRPFEVAHPEVWPALQKLSDPVTRGDPESPLRWTCKSTLVSSAELFSQHGIRISDRTVAKLLRDHGYSLQAPNKSVEGKQHPDRNAQFEHINAKAQDCVERGVPVISVDTEKKERFSPSLAPLCSSTQPRATSPSAQRWAVSASSFDQMSGGAQCCSRTRLCAASRPSIAPTGWSLCGGAATSADCSAATTGTEVFRDCVTAAGSSAVRGAPQAVSRAIAPSTLPNTGDRSWIENMPGHVARALPLHRPFEREHWRHRRIAITTLTR